MIVGVPEISSAYMTLIPIRKRRYTYRDRLNPIPTADLQFIKNVPTPPVKNVDRAMITANGDQATVLGENYLTFPHTSGHSDWICLDSCSRVEAVQGSALGGIVNTKHTFLNVHVCIGAIPESAS